MTRFGLCSQFTRRSFLAVFSFAVVVAIAACSEPTVYVNEPQPEVPAGFFAVAIERVVPPRFSSLAAQDDDSGVRASASALPVGGENVRLEATGSGGVLSTGGRVYLHAEFVLHNDGESELEDLVLLAYNHEAFRASSAISQALMQGDGNVAPDRVVRAIRPTHRLAFDATRSGTPEALVGRANASDFVALRESDVPTLDDAPFVRTLFPYGFRVGGGAAIPPGESATVHVAFSVPAAPATMPNALALESFVWNAVLLRLPGLGVTQAAEENHARGWSAVLDRASAADGAGAVPGGVRVVAIGPGSRAVEDASWCDRLVGIPNVRIAGMESTDPAYAGLVSVPGPPQFDGCEGVSP